MAQIPIRTGGDYSFACGPSWSPDGANIVFSLYLETKGQVDLFTARADGTHLVQVKKTLRNEEFADWERSQ
ncbi:MAG: hypothetical protein M3P10_06055 [Actinomycetota bacterium]|nr:hypothetical protein [Actinomycetota bacterium]MDP9327749.1 hypothetical protein [Actinomycetota bacterium]